MNSVFVLGAIDPQSIITLPLDDEVPAGANPTPVEEASPMPVVAPNPSQEVTEVPTGEGGGRTDLGSLCDKICVRPSRAINRRCFSVGNFEIPLWNTTNMSQKQFVSVVGFIFGESFCSLC